jgi:phage repressor protein C with HTH and peptisase S24 domain
MEDQRHDRLRKARIAAGFEGPNEAASRFNWNVNTYKSNENGAAPFSFKKAKAYAEAYGVRAEWLYDGEGPMKAKIDRRLVPVLGRVGASSDGLIRMDNADRTEDFVPVPPGGSSKAVALMVQGNSMPDVAEDGSIIYFEDQRTPPTEDMIGRVVVVETEDHEVLVKRLQRGSGKKLYNLESIYGEPKRDVRLRWAARIIATIPPHQARKIITAG